jgi:hypothetical protein
LIRYHGGRDGGFVVHFSISPATQACLDEIALIISIAENNSGFLKAARYGGGALYMELQQGGQEDVDKVLSTCAARINDGQIADDALGMLDEADPGRKLSAEILKRAFQF